MGNVFDQFDEASGGGNVFDQFDEPAQEPGLWDRAKIMARDAFEQTGLGTVIRRTESGQAAADTASELDRAIAEAESSGSAAGLERFGDGVVSPYAAIPLDNLRQMRGQAATSGEARRAEWMPQEIARRQQVEALPSFADDPTLTGKLAKGATNIGAMLIGGAPSPENLIPVGRGATLARTFAKGAGVNAAVNVPVDVAAQAQDVELGLQKEIDPARTAIGSALGGVIGGTVNVAPQAARAVRSALTPAPALKQEAPQISGLLGYSEPDPMIAFPDGSVARKSELDAMGLPAEAPVAQRAEMLGRSAEVPPTAEQVVARDTETPNRQFTEVGDQSSGAAAGGPDGGGAPLDSQVTLKDGTPVTLRNEPVGDFSIITAHDAAGNEIGRLTYATARRNGEVVDESVEVAPEARRKGVATAMYDLAESSGGLIPAVDAPGVHRTSDGAAFRNDRTQIRNVVGEAPKDAPAKVGTEPFTKTVAKEQQSAPRPAAIESRPAQIADAPWQKTDVEFGRAYIQKTALPEAQQKLVNAKAGRLQTGKFTEYKSKADAIRQLTAEVERLAAPSDRDAASASSLGDHYREVRLALERGDPVPNNVLARYNDLEGDVAAGRFPKYVRPEDAKTDAPNQKVGSQSADAAIPAERGTSEAGGKGSEADAEVNQGSRDAGAREEVAATKASPEVDEGGRARRGEVEQRQEAPEGKEGQAREEVEELGPYAHGETKLYDIGGVVGEGVAKTAKWMFKGDYSEVKTDMTAMAKAVQGLFGKKSGVKPGEGDPRFFMKRLFNSAFASAHGDIYSLYNAMKKRGVDSPAMKRVIDMTFARSGTGEGVGRTFDEAFDSRVKERLNAIDKVAKLIQETKATDDQVWRQLQNPQARQGKVGQAAKLVEEFFAEQLKYMREAGVDIGEQKNYFTRILDAEKVFEQKARFVQQAKKLYMEDKGMSPDDAQTAAEQYWHASIYGAEGRPGMPAVGNKGNTVKERSFGPAAERLLGDFYRKDIVGTMAQYTTTASRRAEIARRFGDNFGAWEGIEQAMIKEGASEAIGPLRDYVELATGVKQYDVQKLERVASSWARTWFTLGSLTWSTLTSLPELVMPIVRANADAKVAWKGYTDHLNSIVKKQPGRDKGYYRQLAEDIGLVAGAHYGALSAQRFGTDTQLGSYQSRAIEKFFARNLLEPLTNFNRELAASVGTAFLQRQAARVAEGNALASRELRDLGVAKGQEKAFADFVNGLKGRLPDAAELKAAGANGEAYMTALQRFSDQTVMRPGSAIRTRGASNPGVIGLLYHLQSFNYAFTKNVLARMKNRASGALSESDLDSIDRAKLGLAAVPGMAMIVAMQYALGESRDELTETLTGKKRDIQESDVAKIERAISRSGLFGVADPYLQMVSGVRFQRPISTAAGGPVIGTFAEMAQTGANMALNNSENTNNAERRFARNLYRYGIEPAANVAMTSLPVNPATSLVTLLFLPSMREEFVDDIAGDQQRRKPKVIPGISESLLGIKPKSAGERSTGRNVGRSTTRQVGR